jgi:hypothetical protein
MMVPAVQHVDLTGDCNPHALLLQIKAERATIIAKHATALYDLQRLPCFLRLLAQIMLQVRHTQQYQAVQPVAQSARSVVTMCAIGIVA